MAKCGSCSTQRIAELFYRSRIRRHFTRRPTPANDDAGVGLARKEYPTCSASSLHLFGTQPKGLNSVDGCVVVFFIFFCDDDVSFSKAKSHTNQSTISNLPGFSIGPHLPTLPLSHSPNRTLRTARSKVQGTECSQIHSCHRCTCPCTMHHHATPDEFGTRGS